MDTVSLILMVILGIFFGPIIFFSYLRNKKGRQDSDAALAATNEDCDAREALIKWLDDHPDIHPMAMHDGREFVWRCINAYERFRETHPFIKQDNFIAHLRHLCDENDGENIFVHPSSK